MKTPAEIARFLGCTEEQAKVQMRKNALNLRQMAEKASKAKNGKCNGYTAAELLASAAAYEKAIS